VSDAKLEQLTDELVRGTHWLITMGSGDACPYVPGLNSSSAMLHVCRRSLRNVLEQDGTTRDAAGYRLLSIPGGCEVRARFC